LKVVTAEQMQEIDRIAINETGIPGEVLMGFAGRSVSDYIIRNYTKNESIAVFAGCGNNGGDGFVIAYFLFNEGYSVELFLTGKAEKVSVTSRIYMNICINAGVKITELDEKNITDLKLSSYSLVVDSMIGTGFSGHVRGIISDVINRINLSECKVLAVDIPSGLPSNGDAPGGMVVNADVTITMGLPKISLVTYPGKKHTGMLKISEIGFPSEFTRDNSLKTELMSAESFHRILPEDTDPDSHKGKNGHLLLVGGFDGMEGAIIMSALAALETGVGLITLITTEKARSVIAGRIPELITVSLPGSGDVSGIINDSLYNRHYDAIAAGPGIGRSSFSADVFESLIAASAESGIKRILIDGDGLYHYTDMLRKNILPDSPEFIITPHFMEASTIMDKSIDEIKRNRLDAAIKLAQLTSSVALLKGPSTVISDGDFSFINTTGNPALATAGAGDILSGIAGAFLLRDLTPLDAAACAAYVHGKSADIFCEENSTGIMKATDIIKCIRKAMR